MGNDCLKKRYIIHIFAKIPKSAFRIYKSEIVIPKSEIKMAL